MVLKKRQVLTIKSLLCKIALIDSNGYPPPSWWHGFSWKCTLLRFTTHCALPVILVVIRVQSSMKCIICFVLRSSGKFKTCSGVTLILGCCFFMISQVQFIMRHCVHNLFSNLTRKYIYMPFVIQSGFNSYQCMMNTWISGWLKIQMNNIPRFSSVK